MAAELLLEADGVRHARGTAELAGARTPRLNHAFGGRLLGWETVGT
jgi:hypothetical protein